MSQPSLDLYRGELDKMRTAVSDLNRMISSFARLLDGTS